MRNEDEKCNGVQLGRGQLEVQRFVEGRLLRPMFWARLLLLDDPTVTAHLENPDVWG